MINSDFNTQPREGGCNKWDLIPLNDVTVSTHSRAEAAADIDKARDVLVRVSTHSRAEAAASLTAITAKQLMFQHTAARRRLHL